VAVVAWYGLVPDPGLSAHPHIQQRIAEAEAEAETSSSAPVSISEGKNTAGGSVSAEPKDEILITAQTGTGAGK